MVTVTKQKGDTNDKLFREFGTIIFEEELVKIFKDRMFYIKPSQKRKVEEQKWQKNRKKRRNT